jgi:hypothetical protein
VRCFDPATRGNAFHQHVCAMLARAWHTRPESNSLTAPDHYKSSQLSDPIGALPASLFDDSTFSPPLLPRMLTKPRAVCFCQPVAATISANVAPLGALNQRDDLRFGFAGRLSPLCFLLAIGLLGGRVLALHLGSACIPGFLRVACVRARRFLLDRVAVVTSITRARRNCNQNLGD